MVSLNRHRISLLVENARIITSRYQHCTTHRSISFHHATMDTIIFVYSQAIAAEYDAMTRKH